jgi:hypothetical protein
MTVPPSPDKSRLWIRFVEENGYTVPQDASFEEVVEIMGFWQQQLVQAVGDRETLREQLEKASAAVAENEKTLQQMRWRHDDAARRLIERTRAAMEPMNVVKMDAEHSDPFDMDEDEKE